MGEPGIGDGGNDPVGEETYFFFPLKRRINLFALSIVAIEYLFMLKTRIFVSRSGRVAIFPCLSTFIDLDGSGVS